MPKIGNVRIAPIVADSGTFGFYGEGYWWHWLAWPFLFWLKQFGTFVGKTVTANQRDGNMRLNPDGTPMNWFPDCIFIDWYRWIKGGMLNAVGLSNFGAYAHLSDENWQKRTKPWMLSFMPMGGTIEEKIEECRKFFGDMNVTLHSFRIRPILVLNISCPNTEHALCALASDVHRMLDILAQLGLEIIVKVSVDMPVAQVVEIVRHPACKAIQVTNTIHWSKLPEAILRRVFPDCWDEDERKWISPLAQYGGGGYSGKDLLLMVVFWIREAIQAGLEKPIIGGGGIFSPVDVWRVRRAGAVAVSIASPAMLRTFMVPLIVLAAWLYDVFNGEKTHD